MPEEGERLEVEDEIEAHRMWINASDDLADARRLIEKVVSLGGAPAVEVAALTVEESGQALVDHLIEIEIESECVNALQDAIAPTGREGRSEALEHRLEHMIMRKQEAIDFPLRARGRAR
jgi:bacterioferritin (cytochrome b1)